MTATHVVTVCHHGLSLLKGDASRKQHRLCLFEGISAYEVSVVLGALFQIPGHKRVVGLAGTVGNNDDVLIPLLAACRYPNLIFQDEETKVGERPRRNGRVFRTVTKDADHPEEFLFPMSASTPPPPLGSSDLSAPNRNSTTSGTRPTRSHGLLFEGGRCKLDQLVSAGALSSEDGVAVSVMIMEEDPVIFAAFRIATAAAADTSGGGVVGGTAVGAAGEAAASGVRDRLVYMLKIVLEERRRRKALTGRSGGGDCGGGLGEMYRGGCFGFDGRGMHENRTRGHGIGVDLSSSTSQVEVPAAFQSDTIALAEAALVTGVISRRDYLQALYKTITLDPSVVHAYRTDVRQLLLRQDNTGAPAAPRATLQALGASSEAQRRSPAGACLPAYSPSLPHLPAPSAPPFSHHYAGAPAEEGNGCVAERQPAGNCDGVGGDVSTTESVLRDSFLRRALALISEGRPGLSARDKSMVEDAIAAEHPWVAAVYEECKETGDVRGLMQNLQCLPALLERDKASYSGTSNGGDTDRSQQQPPTPGADDWKPPISVLQQLQDRHRRPLPQPTAPPPSLSPTVPSQHQQRVDNHGHSRTSGQRSDRSIPQRSGIDPTQQRSRVDSSGSVAAAAVPGASSIGTERFASAVAARSGRDGNICSGDGITGGGSSGGHGAGSGGVAVVRGCGGPKDAVVSATVIEQLSRVVAGCAHLLRLRGAVAEREEQALRVLSHRGSPVLLAAVEAYGANQDLEDLLDTLTTAAEAEVSLTAGEASHIDHKHTTANDNSSNGSVSAKGRPPSAISSCGASDAGGNGSTAKSLEENPSPYYVSLFQQRQNQRQQQTAVRHGRQQQQQQQQQQQSHRSPITRQQEATAELFGPLGDVNRQAESNRGSDSLSDKPPATAATAATATLAATPDHDHEFNNGIHDMNKTAAQGEERSSAVRDRHEEHPIAGADDNVGACAVSSAALPKMSENRLGSPSSDGNNHNRGSNNDDDNDSSNGGDPRDTGSILDSNGNVRPPGFVPDSSAEDHDASEERQGQGKEPPQIQCAGGDRGPGTGSGDDASSGDRIATAGGGEGAGHCSGGGAWEEDVLDASHADAAPAAPEGGNGSESRRRKTAAGARAQELASAKFAGMKTAAAAKGATAGRDSEPGISSGKGSAEAEPSGDQRLRQDVSQLLSVMKKHGMLTDRQRVFLLAQVGRRITTQARERHAEYLKTGDSKKLYRVLMALSMPDSRNAAAPENEEDGGDDDNDDDDDVDAVLVEELKESEELEEGEEESDDSEKHEEPEELGENRELEVSHELEGGEGSGKSQDIEDIERGGGEISGEHEGDSCFEGSEERPKEEGVMSEGGAGKIEGVREGEGYDQARELLP